MKKSNPRKAATGLLALALSVSPVVSRIAPVLAQTTPLAEDSPLRSDAITSISGLVNPVVQSFTPAAIAGEWQLTSASELAIAATEANTQNTRLAEIVKLINAEMKDKGLIEDYLPAHFLPADSASGNEILIDLAESVSDETTSPEAYQIEIGENGVRLTGVSEQGVLNGLHTIENLLITEGSLPYGTIVDYPDLAERRIHVDCGRKYISKDWFIRLIHEMSYMKLNALQMHFSENLGFRIECETDPTIVSDEYLTKDEVREILAEAKLYGVNIIPSFDTPGHVDQILKAHPEYGQISTTGTHYASGLDVTNPEAVDYIKSLYTEYCELFEGCTDFHIGADEYMEFDRAPFTTIYRSVLNAYAVEKYGSGYTWKDALAGYINEIAELVHDKGFTPRIFNDGIYYGENSSWETKQKIEMHDYIGVDFWSQMTWNSSIARLQNIVDRGHTKIYNFNSSFFYYVLRGSKPTDGREQHSFDNLNADRLIYENWTPGQFSANTVADDASYIAGSALGIWCDVPDLVEEDVIMEDISKEMRAMASKAWNVQSPDEVSYDAFRTMVETLGHAGAYEKGETLEEAPDVLPAGDLGKVIIHYVDGQGNALRADSVNYGLAGEDYSYEPADIYGYRPVSTDPLTGQFEQDTTAELTFVYELYTDYSALETVVNGVIAQESCLEEGWAAYAQALAEARDILANRSVHQSVVDQALSELNQAKSQLKNIRAYALHTELAAPLNGAVYAAGWNAYQQALDALKAICQDFDASQEEIDAAKADLDAAKNGLVKASSVTPEVTATLPAYSTYAYRYMFDGDLSTFTWFDGAQTVGSTIVFTFPYALNMSAVRILSMEDTSDMDYIRRANVEVSPDGEQWNSVGVFEGASRDSTIEFEKQPVKQIRLTLTESSTNWYKIREVYFAYDTEDLSAPLQELIQRAGDLNPNAYTRESFLNLIAAMKDAQTALSENVSDPSQQQTALQTALDALVSKGDVVEEANKILLNAAIAYAQNVQEEDLADLNSLVREEFENALAHAIEIRDKASATQEEVNEAWLRLTHVLQMLNFTANKSALNELIALAEAIEARLGLYEDEGKEEFLNALTIAREVAASETALDERISKAAADLESAMNALRMKQLDTSLLEWLIAQVETEKEADFTPSTWQTFASVLEQAREVVTQAESQDQIDGMVLSLHEAYLQLRRVPSEDLLRQLNDFLQLAQSVELSSALALQQDVAQLCETIHEFLVNPEASQLEGEALVAQAQRLTQEIKALSMDTTQDTVQSASRSDALSANDSRQAQSVKTAGTWQAATWIGTLGAAMAGVLAFRRRKEK